jgi:lysophospholipase L1-like esterase
VRGRAPALLFGVGAYLALAAFVLFGFLGERSALDSFAFGYSFKYLVLIAAVSAALATPLFLLWLMRRVGARKVLFALAPISALGLLGGFAGSQYYYATVTHYFDPFLQSPPAWLGTDDWNAHGCRILAAGGSTTANGTLAPADRYPRQLDRLLAQLRPEAQPHVFNAGMAFWTVKHNLINYVTYTRRWRPDVVVFMEAINDLYRSFSPEEYAAGPYNPLLSHFYGASIRGARPATFLQQVFRDHLSVLGEKWYARDRFIETDWPLSRYRSLAQFGPMLRALVHYVRSDGAEIVLMTQPSLLKPQMTPEERATLMFGRYSCIERTGWLTSEYPSSASLLRAHDAFNATVRQVAAELDTPLIDLAAAIPRDLAHFTDDVHYTPRGAARIAQLVADRVSAMIADAERKGSGPCARFGRPR